MYMLFSAAQMAARISLLFCGTIPVAIWVKSNPPNSLPPFAFSATLAATFAVGIVIGFVVLLYFVEVPIVWKQ
jgi:hypothetical protein